MSHWHFQHHGSSLGGFFRIESLESLQGFVNVLRADPVTAPFTERISKPSGFLYLKKFYRVCRYSLYSVF